MKLAVWPRVKVQFTAKHDKEAHKIFQEMQRLHQFAASIKGRDFCGGGCGGGCEGVPYNQAIGRLTGLGDGHQWDEANWRSDSAKLLKSDSAHLTCPGGQCPHRQHTRSQADARFLVQCSYPFRHVSEPQSSHRKNPFQIGHLKSLTSLSLSSNQLIGQIPESISALVKPVWVSNPLPSTSAKGIPSLLSVDLSQGKWRVAVAERRNRKRLLRMQQKRMKTYSSAVGNATRRIIAKK
ncbi:hypothetical protein RJ639_041305, partial [Escallonia herrerae]